MSPRLVWSRSSLRALATISPTMSPSGTFSSSAMSFWARWWTAFRSDRGTTVGCLCRLLGLLEVFGEGVLRLGALAAHLNRSFSLAARPYQPASQLPGYRSVRSHPNPRPGDPYRGLTFPVDPSIYPFPATASPREHAMDKVRIGVIGLGNMGMPPRRTWIPGGGDAVGRLRRRTRRRRIGWPSVSRTSPSSRRTKTCWPRGRAMRS